jgi:hypothetical protein
MHMVLDDSWQKTQIRDPCICRERSDLSKMRSFHTYTATSLHHGGIRQFSLNTMLIANIPRSLMRPAAVPVPKSKTDGQAHYSTGFHTSHHILYDTRSIVVVTVRKKKPTYVLADSKAKISYLIRPCIMYT